VSWHFSQAMEEAFSAVSSADFTQFAPLKSMITPVVCSWPVKKTDASQPFLFGTTCEHLMVGRGVGWWISSLAASRAKMSVSLAPGGGLMEKEAACGKSNCESWAKLSPDSYSWKIRPRSHTVVSMKSSSTWPRWGIMRFGECWEQSMPGHLTKEKGSGFWPTPLHSEARQGLQIRRPGKKGSQISLSTAVKMYPTPTVQDAKNNGAQSQQERNMRPLNAVVGGSLNPPWVEWLMGFPGGWTDLAVSVTHKFQQWLKLHGIYYAPAPDSLAKALPRD